jgi:para-nitrobenzyl esterase
VFVGKRIAAAAVALFISSVGRGSSPEIAKGADDSVEVEGGRIAGVPLPDSPGVVAYKGIPFAAPPLGDLRWKPPQPVVPWEGVRDARAFGPACSQRPYPEGSLFASKLERVSEDCLNLNVWTVGTAATEPRPVLVWIHGGSLTRGAGSLPFYDGAALAGKGAVVVTINYRLGAFGFLALPGLTAESEHRASGNYGLLDQVAALRWVQRNIRALGGDPGRVTIVGESAGSRSVAFLLSSPLARGLFHRAIGESGGGLGVMQSLKEAEEAGAKWASSFADTSLGALRAKSAEDVLSATGAAGFPVIVDGWALPRDVTTTFAEGAQNDVPTLVGYNADEATALYPFVPTPATAYVEKSRLRYGALTEDFLRIYPVRTDDDARAAHNASLRDSMLGWATRSWARAATATGKSKVYSYYFTRVPPGFNSERYGAFHGAEIAYVFGNLQPPRPWQDVDRALSAAMMSYWINFAIHGNPNGAGLPPWPAYEAVRDTVLTFGDTIGTRSGVNRRGIDFFDIYWAKVRSGELPRPW